MLSRLLDYTSHYPHPLTFPPYVIGSFIWEPQVDNVSFAYLRKRLLFSGLQLSNRIAISSLNKFKSSFPNEAQKIPFFSLKKKNLNKKSQPRDVSVIQHIPNIVDHQKLRRIRPDLKFGWETTQKSQGHDLDCKSIYILIPEKGNCHLHPHNCQENYASMKFSAQAQEIFTFISSQKGFL